MNNLLLDAALRYRRVRLSIIPLQPRSKFPDLQALRVSGNLNHLGQPSWSEFYRRLATHEEALSWFGSGDRNLGLLSGYCQLLILDFDERESYEEWSTHYTDIAARTSTQRTAKGFHVLFRWAKTWTMYYRTGTGFSLLESESPHLGHMKGAFGWIAGWPSVNPEGYQYEWLPGQAPWETGILRIERLEDIGVEPTRKIPQAHVAFLRRLLLNPRDNLPMLSKWLKYRWNLLRGTAVRY